MEIVDSHYPHLRLGSLHASRCPEGSAHVRPLGSTCSLFLRGTRILRGKDVFQREGLPLEWGASITIKDALPPRPPGLFQKAGIGGIPRQLHLSEGSPASRRKGTSSLPEGREDASPLALSEGSRKAGNVRL